MAFKSSIIALGLTCKEEYSIPNQVFKKILNIVSQFIRQYLIEYGAIKRKIIVLGYFEKIYPEEMIIENCERVLTGKNEIISKNDDIEDSFEKGFNKISEQHEQLTNNEAYCQLRKIIKIEIRMKKFLPIKEASSIKTPKKIANAQSTINIQNKDQEIFRYCILYHEHKDKIVEDPQRVLKDENLKSKYDFSMVKYPTSFDGIEKFEKKNNLAITFLNDDLQIEKIAKVRSDDRLMLVLLEKK